MKGYKHTYCASLPCFGVKLFIICLPSSVAIDILLSILGHVKVGTMIGSILLGLLIFVAAGVLFMISVTILINCFKEASVMLDENTIVYNNIKLDLNSIEYVTLYLPEIKGRTSVSILELSLYINDKEHIVIRRPSVALIAYLKKRCKNAKFEIDELKSKLKIDFIIGICVAVVVLFIALFAH